MHVFVKYRILLSYDKFSALIVILKYDLCDFHSAH